MQSVQSRWTHLLSHIRHVSRGTIRLALSRHFRLFHVKQPVPGNSFIGDMANGLIRAMPHVPL